MDFKKIIDNIIIPLLNENFVEVNGLSNNLRIFNNKKEKIEITLGMSSTQGGELVLYLNKSEENYDLEDLIALTEIHIPTYMTNENILSESVKKIKAILSYENHALLTGSKRVYKKLKKIRDNRIDEYNKKKELDNVITEANYFWANKNYQNYINIVQPHIKKLPLLFNKRFNIAKKKLSELG